MMKQFVCAPALAVCLTAAALFAADPWPAEQQAAASNIGGGLAGIEPSDAVWHPRLRQIFIVGDGGQVVRMDPDGTHITRWNSVGGDLEGITFADVDRPYIYVGQENWPMIAEVNIETGVRGREWPLNEMAFGANNQRLEALTFLPDGYCGGILRSDGQPYNAGRGSVFGTGGLFLAGHQTTGQIFIYDVNLQSAGTRVFVNAVGPILDGATPLNDLSGMCFHRPSGMLFCVWDGPGRVGAVDVSVTGFLARRIWYVPQYSHDEEGIALLDGGCQTGESRIVITQDDNAGGHDVWVYDGFSLPVTTPSGDVNGDGFVDSGDIQILTTALLSGLPPPGPTCGWDINQDGELDGEDIAALVALLLH